MMEWIRGELVGPSRPLTDPEVVRFEGSSFTDLKDYRNGPVAWRPSPEAELQEVLYYERESPQRKYGAGMLHPPGLVVRPEEVTDTMGFDVENDEVEVEGVEEEDESLPDHNGTTEGISSLEDSDDFEVVSPDVWHPSTMGVSFCVKLDQEGELVVKLPVDRRFTWQEPEAAPFQLNGRYESGTRIWTDKNRNEKTGPVWRRYEAVTDDSVVRIQRAELAGGSKIQKAVPLPEDSPLALEVEVFPRKVKGSEDVWLLTLVLRNASPSAPSGNAHPHESVLHQAFFEISVEGGRFEKYPESQRPFEQLDEEEQSLELLYRESATWAIGHGCAAGWDAQPSQTPSCLYTDVMPAVELPSMTPDIEDEHGNSIQLSMRALAGLQDDGTGEAWVTLQRLSQEFGRWIGRQDGEAKQLPGRYRAPAERHLENCRECLGRIEAGIDLLRTNANARRAFRLANLAMMLQQIAQKELGHRELVRNESPPWVGPKGTHRSPWDIYSAADEGARLGKWRAFQIAFLLMSLKGVSEGSAEDWLQDREVVDLIWFPTGGGKTEAYLAVMAYFMFHERCLIKEEDGESRRDGTNVLMRYTLRMLTTQQFQRAASLVCAMEFLRRNPEVHGLGDIFGKRFSVGLWIGSGGAPNKNAQATTEISLFVSERMDGNPLVLTECPWCRAAIGRFDGPRPKQVTSANWKHHRLKGISRDGDPKLFCPDALCEFGQESPETWLPVEVIDEQIYEAKPSLVIATADKFAMVAYRPASGALFGNTITADGVQRSCRPPGLIIQDELHLISGPLGTMYALYEGVLEKLCTWEFDGAPVKPKLISSTATIRGADDQVKALYARNRTKLFPSPSLMMGDSFFGKYAKKEDGSLASGRMYLGIHASEYGSVLTTQVRTFASTLFRPHSFADDKKDPWWTLLTFYNSIRELGGAKTLFDSDIRSRLKHIFNRENFTHDDRRKILPAEELTSRLSQAEIVEMMDKLAVQYSGDFSAVDAVLASNIIEVGVDIERLSLMGVVGQPKTTSTYIQVTGRVGRQWWDRPGLILMIYSPAKSRDRSHFEQFHSYHRRLYERVEPTSATPFAISAIQRGLPGVLIAWARQQSTAEVFQLRKYRDSIEHAYQLLCERCREIQSPEDRDRSIDELKRVRDKLIHKWEFNPQEWEDFPPKNDGEYLMLWPGQYYEPVQKNCGVRVPSSMRQVDGSGELTIHQGYLCEM